MKIPPHIVAPILDVLYRLWCGSLRYTVVGREEIDALEQSGKPMVFCLWHDELFTVIHLKKTLEIITIVSQSRDGEYLARLLQALGFKTARGSSSRGGLSALLQAAKVIQKEGFNGCVTVDGPRGPRHKVKEGALFLAHKAPAHIVPLRMFAARAIRFHSWDRFQLPLPFSRVFVTFEKPYLLDEQELTEKTIKEACEVLEKKLNNVTPPVDFFHPEKKWKYRLFASLAHLLQKSPLQLLYRFGSLGAALLWYLAPNRKKLAVKAVEKHLQVPAPTAQKIARKSFDHNFRSFLEIFYAKQLYASPERMVVTESPGLEAFKAEQGPIVVATAHIGSWELMEPYAAMLQPDKKRIVVVRGQKDKALNRVMCELRSSGGVESVEHRNATKIAMECLRHNGLAAFLVDHNTNKREAIFLPFLEDIAAVNQGPALLALRAKATVFPSFLLRNESGGHTLYIDTPLRTADLTGTVGERVEQIASYYTNSVARIVRQYPEQWFWMHKRWKTRP